MENDLIPEKGTMMQLLWMLMYLKNYHRWNTMNTLTGVDPKTLRNWILLFVYHVEQLEGLVVSTTLVLLLFFI
jgi:hypothetical protein